MCMMLLASLYLTGCGGGSSSSAPAASTTPAPITAPAPTPTLASFEVKVTNVTNNQPLSPVAVIVHNAKYSAWTVGSSASSGLELLAEGGSNSGLLASLPATDAASASGTGAIVPGGNETITVTTSASDQTLITIATMLINTNDAFAGADFVDVSGLAIGDSVTINATVYDAGTELNSEANNTMPGPADGGEGFNADRTDINDIVRSHGGVVTADDGLNTSVLNQSHRFDNPAIVVTITRI